MHTLILGSNLDQLTGQIAIDCGEIEFIALRNAISTADLVEFIDLNANRAADNFRGLRVRRSNSMFCLVWLKHSIKPTEPGSITAFGLSAGPRHRRMFGYARNLLYPNRWTESELTRMHHDLLACASLVWMVAESRLPAAVLNQIESDFVKSGLPGIFTSQIEEGQLDRHFLPAILISRYQERDSASN